MKAKLRRMDGAKIALASAIVLGIVSIVLVPFMILSAMANRQNSGLEIVLAVIFPVLYFAFTYIITRPMIWLANKVLKWMDGIEIDLDIEESGKDEISAVKIEETERPN